MATDKDSLSTFATFFVDISHCKQKKWKWNRLHKS